jgi:glycosyltransferase involved in cell wall biosynthesis
MKILLINSSYKPNIGGVEEFTSKLCSFFIAKSHKVYITSAKWPVNLSKFEIIDSVEINRFNFILPSKNIIGSIRFIILFPIVFIKFCSYLRKINPDIANIQCVSSNGFYALLAKKLLKLKLIVSLHGETVMDDYDIYNKSFILKWTLRKLMKEADWITANSKYTLDDALDRFGGDRSKCSVIYNGVDLDEFEGVEPYKHDKPYIFATGRLVYKKGFDLLIKAFSKVSDKYKDIDLLISGKGEYESNLRSLIDKLGLSDRVKLLGPADRKLNVSLFKGCEFFVMPSRLEPFGIVCVEAMAAGKAFIATKNGGPSEFAKNVGLLVDPENINELSEALDKLISNKKLRLDLEQLSKEKVKSLTWPEISEQYIDIFKKVKK